MDEKSIFVLFTAGHLCLYGTPCGRKYHLGADRERFAGLKQTSPPPDFQQDSAVRTLAPRNKPLDREHIKTAMGGVERVWQGRIGNR